MANTNTFKKPKIAVDLDGTLAIHYWPEDGPFHILRIGAPIPLMVERIRNWIDLGYEVVIFTARMSHPDRATRVAVKAEVAKYTLDHVGAELEATAIKTMDISEFWDDRAIRVEHNTGRI
jgi:hypothetical protein